MASYSWLLDACDKHLPVTTQLLQAEAVKLVSPTYPEFKASNGWVQKFKQRHSLVLRVKSSMAQSYQLRWRNELPPFVASSDASKRSVFSKWLVTLTNPRSTSMRYKVALLTRKGIIVWTTGSQKRHLTVTLCVTHVGDVLPALVMVSGPYRFEHRTFVSSALNTRHGWTRR